MMTLPYTRMGLNRYWLEIDNEYFPFHRVENLGLLGVLPRLSAWVYAYGHETIAWV